MINCDTSAYAIGAVLQQGDEKAKLGHIQQGTFRHSTHSFDLVTIPCREPTQNHH